MRCIDYAPVPARRAARLTDARAGNKGVSAASTRRSLAIALPYVGFSARWFVGWPYGELCLGRAGGIARFARYLVSLVGIVFLGFQCAGFSVSG